MKQRVTYVVTNPEDFSPEQIELKEDEGSQQFRLKGLRAAKEHRLTLGLDELPSEISNALQQWHELHLRWASGVPYTSTPPFTSRVSPGLHVFFTPLDSAPQNALCDQLQTFIHADMKCSSTNETSIKLPVLSERFSMSTSAQYYGDLSAISSILGRLRVQFCDVVNKSTCSNLLQSMTTAEYVDVDYDTITRALVVTAGWPSTLYNGEKAEAIERKPGDGTVEIGVLMHEHNSDPEDIQFGGFLTVLGQDTHPKATRFQAPARHYPLLSSSSTDPNQSPKPHPLTFTTSFQQPTGLHPTLILSFPKQHLAPPNPTCKLHAHLTLPSYLFIDKYQFSDSLFLGSKHLQSLRSLAGATDLEAPDWVVKQWGSAALFELAHPDEPEDDDDNASTPAPSSSSTESWNISIPMHLRYLPGAYSSHTRLPVPWPVVFWACRADEGAKMAANPFDRVHLGYEALFGPKTRFMHVQPSVEAGEHFVRIDVPVLDLRKTGWVEAGTVGTVVVAFLGLCWVLFGRLGGGKGEREVVAGKKKQ